MIIKYIGDFGSITPMDAFMDLGCTKLATRVSELKREGYSIADKWERGRNRYGKATRWKRYRLKEDKDAEQNHQGDDTHQ